jgi:hypothetical protein
MKFVFFIAPILLALLSIALGEEKPATFSPEHEKFFENEIRPLLIEHCHRCHGEDNFKGGLRLDSLGAILEGGDSGAAAVAGKASESLLIEAVRYDSLEMPPDEKLSDRQIDLLTQWVEMGLPWPGSNDGPAKRNASDRFTQEDRAWWAIQPIKKTDPPKLDRFADLSLIDTWSHNPIDPFILDKMQSSGLRPAVEADRTNLIRRVYYDLIGLPPTIEQVHAFVQDDSPDAYKKVVDELLMSPRYGERWARYWLDLVRYADSDGYRIDNYRPNAWRYRDYVIASLNSDKPYDRFIQEQSAGDKLFPDDPQARVAIGFLRHWIYEYNNRDVRGQWQTILNDITDTTADVFLGLGLQCAKCHDHKFDPLLQKDYYRLQAFFAPLISNTSIVSSPAEQAAYAEKLADWESRTVDLRNEITAIETKSYEKATKDAQEKFPPDIQAILRKPESERSPLEKQLHEIAYRQVIYEHDRIDSKVKGDLKEKYLAIKKELSQVDKFKPKPLATALTAIDVGPVAPEITIPKRGKKPVLPGYPTLLDPRVATIVPPISESTTGPRSTLARWLSDGNNPLTARVMVNRIWKNHFGRGLAANASDFGKLGGAPSHPELLDWLAAVFIEDGWSLKQLHRRIVTSATYRQSSLHESLPEFQQLDPSNAFYWRSDTRRLDAEQIRDSIFTASGEFRHPEVLSVSPAELANGESHRMEGGEGVLPDVPKRSIYTRTMRNSRDPLLDVFDLPLFFASESSRNTTTTPVQALILFNSSEMLRFAGLMAEDIWLGRSSEDQRIQRAFEIAYSRRATDNEPTFTICTLRFCICSGLVIWTLTTFTKGVPNAQQLTKASLSRSACSFVSLRPFPNTAGVAVYGIQIRSEIPFVKLFFGKYADK